MKQTLSPKEYALKHGLSLQAVYIRIWLKKVAASKAGRCWLIDDNGKNHHGTENDERV